MQRRAGTGAAAGQLTRGQPRAEGGGLLRWVRASRGNTTSHVPIQDVMYFHSDDKYVVVHTRDGEHLDPHAVAGTGRGPGPRRVLAGAPLDHRQHGMRGGTRRDESGRLFVRMRDSDTELPVSRAYVHRFRQM
jgi:DNA-binding LytR/AlgR family response regulator